MVGKFLLFRRERVVVKEAAAKREKWPTPAVVGCVCVSVLYVCVWLAGVASSPRAANPRNQAEELSARSC